MSTENDTNKIRDLRQLQVTEFWNTYINTLTSGKNNFEFDFLEGYKFLILDQIKKIPYVAYEETSDTSVWVKII